MLEIKYNDKDHAAMVLVRAGEFWMGSDTHRDDEKPERRIHLDDFWIYQYPVTVAQYSAYCRIAGLKMPPRPSWGWYPDHPVVNVNWYDASRYCRWAGVSLPTEAEWEKAARGVDSREYPWGNEWDPEKCMCSIQTNGDAKTTEAVTAFPEGVSPYGAWDMAGNVLEWCAENGHVVLQRAKPGVKEAMPQANPVRVLRGGGWNDFRPDYFRCASRVVLGAYDVFEIVGFRCVVRPRSALPAAIVAGLKMAADLSS